MATAPEATAAASPVSASSIATQRGVLLGPSGLGLDVDIRIDVEVTLLRGDLPRRPVGGQERFGHRHAATLPPGDAEMNTAASPRRPRALLTLVGFDTPCGATRPTRKRSVPVSASPPGRPDAPHQTG